MRTLRRASGILAVLIATGSLPAWGWGNAGHQIVCEIAFQSLNDAAKREVVRLIRTDPDFTTFAEACTWPDRPPRVRAADHVINAPRDFGRFTSERCPMAPTCLFTALAADLKVLRASTDDRERLAALKFVRHWVGDIHQPLHVSYADDRGGNRIRELGPCSGGDLHGVWDTCIIGQGIGDRPLDVARALLGEITPAQPSVPG